MFRCSDGLHHVTLDVLVAPWRENDIFGFLGFGMQIEGGQNTVSTHVHCYYRLVVNQPNILRK